MKRFDTGSKPIWLYHNHGLLFVLNGENKVFDITEKQSPSFLASFSLPSDGYMKTLLTIFKKWAFFNSGYQGLFLLDINDSSNPVCVNLLPDPSLKFQHLKDNYFIGALGEKGGRIYDLKQPFELKTVGQIADTLLDFIVHKNFLLGASKNHGLKVFDLASVEEPILTAHPFGNFLCMCLELFHDNLALVKNEFGQILIVDISDPRHIRQLATIEGKLYPYKSFFVHYPFLIVHMTELGHSFKVFDCSNPSDPRLVFIYHGSHANHYVNYLVKHGPLMALWGSRNDNYSLDILRVSNTGEIMKIVSVDEGIEPYSVTIVENFIYLVKGDGIFVAAIPES